MSEDPDQTAPLGAVWSGSALFAQTCLSVKIEESGVGIKIIWQFLVFLARLYKVQVERLYSLWRPRSR